MIRKQHSTLRCIADKLDVSASTVSRILSGEVRRYRISRKTERAFLRTPMTTIARKNETMGRVDGSGHPDCEGIHN